MGQRLAGWVLVQVPVRVLVQVLVRMPAVALDQLVLEVKPAVPVVLVVEEGHSGLLQRPAFLMQSLLDYIGV